MKGKHIEKGTRFGMLTVMELSPERSPSRARQYICECDCGKITNPIPGTRLRFGNTASCGCGVGQKQKELKTTHSKSRTKTYKVWTSMKQRCSNPNNVSYEWYGGRGITYDPKWETFEGFLEDMGEKPKGLEIDRIDSNGNYCKENCRWVTEEVNANNKKSITKYSWKGNSLSLPQIARQESINTGSLRTRVYRYGDSIEVAVSKLKTNKPKVSKKALFTFSKGEETVTMNRLDFSRHIGAVTGNVTQLILGERKSCKGWSMA